MSDRDDEENAIFDETFRQMTEDLHLDPTQIAATVVSTLSNLELLKKFNEVRDEAMDRGELVYPTTDTGKDLQTQYHAYLLECRKRGLK